MTSIAIVGMFCRFPNANDPDSFYQNILNQEDAVTEVPPERWNIDDFYDPRPATIGKASTKWGAFIDDFDKFDAEFFGISDAEANTIDPQQRIVLETTWKALESAYIIPKTLEGSDTGVFIGASSSDYETSIYEENDLIGAFHGTSTYLSLIANRLSYCLNLKGPSMSVDTACSSSLVATHLASQSLNSRECDLAIAGGVNMILRPEQTITLSHAGLMSDRCRTFEASADGYVRAEGCGVFILKRLQDAIDCGDPILAVIRGSATNQDGRSNGITAPNGVAQKALLRKALAHAGVSADEVDVIEVHGIGTRVGDPIEVSALKAVFCSGRDPLNKLALSSVKANMGHAEAASGMAGMIKCILAFNHGVMLPHLKIKEFNPLVERVIKGSSLYIPVESEETQGQNKQVAGISGFGFGGTNAHVILQQAPTVKHRSELNNETVEMRERSTVFLKISAKSVTSLRLLAGNYGKLLNNITSPDQYRNICFTANAYRSDFNHKIVAIGSEWQQIGTQLTAFANGKSEKNISLLNYSVDRRLRVKLAMLCSGEGAEYAGMGQELYASHSVFRATLDQCGEQLKPELEHPLLDVMFDRNDLGHLLSDARYAHLALFAFEVALAQLWLSWGVTPVSITGYGVGQYSAGCVAKVFTLKEGLKLVLFRARLIELLPLTTKLPLTSVSELQRNDSVEDHLPGIQSLLSEFSEIANKIKYATPVIKIVEMTEFEGDPLTPEYWVQHTFTSINLTHGFGSLVVSKTHVFLEVGPQSTITERAKQWAKEENSDISCIASLSRDQNNWNSIYQALGLLYAENVAIQWSQVDNSTNRKKHVIPTYSFDKIRYWLEPLPAPSSIRASTINFPSKISIEPPEKPNFNYEGVMPEHCDEGKEVDVILRGRRYRVMAWGSEHAPVVLCIHNIFEQGLMWQELARSLSLKGYRVIAPDLLGHGLSDHVAEDGSYSLLGFVADIEALVREYEITLLSIIGHAAGCIIAAIYAASNPDTTERLILIEPSLPNEENELNFFDQQNEEMIYQDKTGKHTVVADIKEGASKLRTSIKEVEMERVYALAGRVLQPTENGYRWTWDYKLRTRSGMKHFGINRSSYLNLLSQIYKPVTIIKGDGGYSKSNDVALLQKQLKAKMVEATGGHYLHLTNAKAVSSEILSLLGSEATR